ncbi:magnesium transporter [Leptospira wolffii]|uniref:Magnesium transporter MgtE n=1 Tax=Leptospira wolffii TaxID=409998 RepID=A0A2M9Z9K8_9LEPT|nr:magnesium transporter [Leptospira wolffii]PJZ65105.1 magnesium transporter [Leptospira wolffii]TGK56767.1 magnesium transporter [Leptospira wolffii]TGK71651.1 magnesium transporter [Leptospira wolffii]TGK75492.1 magnesium transporter [Leptospira wolffii]TGL33018.1 magnesium transporter [Leptospira wolffii]
MEDKNTSKEALSLKSQPQSGDWMEFFSEKIEKKDTEFLLAFTSANHPADIAEVLERLDIEDAFYVFKLCDSEQQSMILVEFDEELQADLISRLNMKEISPIVENLETDEVTNLISEIPKEKAEEILNSLDKEDSSQIRKQLNFREYTAGRLMTTEFAAAFEFDTVRKAIIKLRRVAKETDDIYLLYVTDAENHLTGFIKLKDLFLAPLNQKVSRLVKEEVFSIHYDTDQEEVARMFRKYDLVSAAVVDDLNRIIGRITVDDILDIVQEEASEDILRMGGVSEEERLNTSVWDSIRRRLVWLFVNLGTATIASTTVSFFEDTIHNVVFLAALMPIVAGMGGNAGTQAITVVVRNIATGDLNSANWLVAFRKESLIGIINGLTLGSITGLAVYFFWGKPALAIVIFLAMLANLILAAIVGACIPMALKVLRIDPAIASSIFVTMTTDTFGFFCFLGLATLFLQYLV